MGKVFAQEDGNLEVIPITATRSKTYKDIDLTFTARTSGDISVSYTHLTLPTKRIV